jgi:DNA polymerase-3 subunit delta'
MIGGKREASEISVEQVRRLVLSRAAYPPHEGRAQVFIVHDAHELSISAANALLKTLEEPRPSTYFVLLTSKPDRLLDTIRSRSLPIRFGPLPDAVVAELLRERGLAEERVVELVDRVAGSMEAALAEVDADQEEEHGRFVREVREAVDAPDLGAAVLLGEAVGRDRGGLVADLLTLAASYAREARDAVSSDPATADLAARRHEIVLDAIDAVERNGAATLALASLLASLRHGYQRRPGIKPPVVVQRR